jgi:hypothetical protein
MFSGVVIEHLCVDNILMAGVMRKMQKCPKTPALISDTFGTDRISANSSHQGYYGDSLAKFPSLHIIRVVL